MDVSPEQSCIYFHMSSLKFLCALQVQEKAGIQELDEYVSEVKDFLSEGKNGFFQGKFTSYRDLIKTLGWKKVVNGGTEYYVNRKGRICGLLEAKGYFVLDEQVFPDGKYFSAMNCPRKYNKKDVNLVILRETRYDDGKKNGLEIVRDRKGRVTARTNWKQDKKHGKSDEFDEGGLMISTAHYNEGSLVSQYTVYSTTIKGKTGVF